MVLSEPSGGALQLLADLIKEVSRNPNLSQYQCLNQKTDVFPSVGGSRYGPSYLEGNYSPPSTSMGFTSADSTITDRNFADM